MGVSRRQRGEWDRMLAMLRPIAVAEERRSDDVVLLELGHVDTGQRARAQKHRGPASGRCTMVALRFEASAVAVVALDAQTMVKWPVTAAALHGFLECRLSV